MRPIIWKEITSGIQEYCQKIFSFYLFYSACKMRCKIIVFSFYQTVPDKMFLMIGYWFLHLKTIQNKRETYSNPKIVLSVPWMHSEPRTVQADRAVMLQPLANQKTDRLCVPGDEVQRRVWPQNQRISFQPQRYTLILFLSEQGKKTLKHLCQVYAGVHWQWQIQNWSYDYQLEEFYGPFRNIQSLYR